MTVKTTPTGTLYLALERGWDKGLMACATQAAGKPRFRALPARDLSRLSEGIAKAQQRLGLPAAAPVGTCYEAGREACWRHRVLTRQGIANGGVDSGALEVNRRSTHVKTAPSGAGKLLQWLCRYHGGERKVGSVVNVPTAADEDRRQLHRGRKDLQGRQTECSNRIQGLLAAQGLGAPGDANCRPTLAALRDRAGKPVPAGWQERLLQEFAVGEGLHRPVRDAANAQARPLRGGKDPYLDQVR